MRASLNQVKLGPYAHPKYGKYIVKRKRYPCHDPESICLFGDKVEIEVRPPLPTAHCPLPTAHCPLPSIAPSLQLVSSILLAWCYALSQPCAPLSRTKTHLITRMVRRMDYIDRAEPSRLLVKEADLASS